MNFSPVTPSQRPQLTSLQAGRAVAAIMVVIFHLNGYFLPEVLYAGKTLPDAAKMGFAGVEYFFALSGFLMVLAHAKDFGRSSRVRNFAWRRLTRIYPVYWLILLALVAAHFVLPSMTAEGALPLQTVLANMSLLPLSEPAILEVAWTLQYEVAFYVMFATLIVSLRIGIGLLAFWFAGCVAALVVFEPAFPLSFIVSPYNFIFFAGMAAAALYKKLRPSMAIGSVLGGTAIFLSTGLSYAYAIWPYGEGWSTVALGLGAALMIAGLASLEHRGYFTAPKALVLTGDASYSLYLLHIPLLAVATKFVAGLGLNQLVGPFSMTVLLTIGCVAASVLFFRLVERPLVAALQGKRASTTPAHAA